MKKSVNSYLLSFNLKLFRTKVDIKSVIRNYSLGNYVVNVQSLKTCKLSECSIEIYEDLTSHLCSLATNCRGLMLAMFTARLTNLCLAHSFILTIVSTGQKSSELLFTLTLGSCYRKVRRYSRNGIRSTNNHVS